MKIWKIAAWQQFTLPAYYNNEIAKTTKDPKILAGILELGRHDYVSLLAAKNPYAPPKALAAFLQRREVNDVSKACAANPNTPQDILIEILNGKQNNRIEWAAAENPNTPFEAKMEWIENVGMATDMNDGDHPLNLWRYHGDNSKEGYNNLRKNYWAQKRSELERQIAEKQERKNKRINRERQKAQEILQHETDMETIENSIDPLEKKDMYGNY